MSDHLSAASETGKHVNFMLLTATSKRASEIRITSDGARLLIDGQSTDYPLPADARISWMIQRLKYMAGLDVDEDETPQEGVIIGTVNNMVIDFHLRTSPAAEGECATLRIAPRSK